MYDTIAALVRVDDSIPQKRFRGQSITETFEKNGKVVRLFHNPREHEEYGPRVTYWPHEEGEGGWLKAEFSIPKMVMIRPGEQHGFRLLDNPTEADAREACARVNERLMCIFGQGLAPVEEWRAQRIDYAWNWQVGSLLPAYMSVLHKLRLGTWTRHPYDAAEGVVWKSKSTTGRWVKFYNKTRQLAGSGELVRQYGPEPQPLVLRYEVSSYKDSAAYMGEKWFGDRTVGAALHAGRAFYVLSRFWDKLGLGKSDSYGHEEYLLARMAEVFGTRSVPSAWYVLHLYRDYGSSAHRDLGLVTKSTYHYQVSRLKENGFIVSVDMSDDVDYDSQTREQQVHLPALPALHLSVSTQVLESLKKLSNLESSDQSFCGDRQKISWENMRPALGLLDGVRVSPYAWEQVNEQFRTFVDTEARGVEAGN